MAQMSVPAQKIINVKALFFDPNRDSAPIGRAVLQSAGLINTQFHLDLDIAREYQDSTPSGLLVVDLSPDTKKMGMALIRSARRSKTEMPPRILGLLSGGTRDDLIEAIKCGVDTVAVKPLAPDSLYKKISMLMKAPQNYLSAKNYHGPDRRRVPDASEYTGENRRG